MQTAATPLPTAPQALLAKLRVMVPTATVPAFEQALLSVQSQLDQLSEALIQSGEPDKYGADGQALQAATRSAERDFRARLIDAIDAIAPEFNTKNQKFNLSLIEEEHMQVQLVCERLVERLSYVQRSGLLALDQRLCKALAFVAPLGPRMPLSPQIFADAAKTALAEMQLSDEFKAQVIQHFDLLLDPVLSDLLKEVNAGLAAAGVLPGLIIQAEEERIRRQSIKVPMPISSVVSASPPADQSAGTESAQYDRAIQDKDRSLVAQLLEHFKNIQMNLGSGGHGGEGQTPQRAIAKTETLAMLDRLQHGSGNTNAVLEAIGKPDGSIADTIKRELLQNARQMGVTQGDEQATLEPAEESAVQMAGNLFEVMLKDRPFGDAVAPVLAQLVMPFVRAAVIDPQLFLERHHPARQFLNTVSEACEDNLGETPQERELLNQVENAVQRITDEYDGDVGKFQAVDAQLSEQMQTYRRRTQLSEKRAGEAQQGQERLEVSRLQANKVVNGITRQYALPGTLRNFFNTEWLHHLSVTALRKGTDSEDFIKATRVAQPWIDLLDMVSLGEILPLSHLDGLESSTNEVLASSGISGESAADFFQVLINSVSEWTEEIVTPIDTPMDSCAPSGADNQTPTATSTIVKPLVEITIDMASSIDSLKPTETELKEVSEYKLGTWLQMPKAEGGYQQLKVAWISGISGSIMFVNRRGARVMVLSPPELVALRRRNDLLLFEDESPVDQAMAQLLEKLKRQ
jgi:hypothetical protein